MIDFNVNISTLTTSVSRQSFGLILVLDTTQEHPYTLYNSVSDVSEDFDSEDRAYKLAAKIFQQNPAPQQVAIFGVDAGTPSEIADGLNDLVEKNNEWFGLVSTANEKAEVEAISDWVESVDKVYAVTSDDLTISAEIENEQTMFFYHDDTEDFVAEGLLAYMLVRDIGGVTGKFKTISGSTEADISATELNQLHGDNGNTYIRKMGVLQTTEGKSTTGEYFDVVLGKFFIKFRMQEELAMVALNNEKIPYSDEGIAMLVGAVKTILELATDNGIILEEEGEGVFDIDFRRRADVPTSEVANREYNYLTWDATLAGAIHKAQIDGVLTL